MTDKRQLYILLATTLSSFLTPFMGSAVNVALPAMAKELSMTALSLSWVASSFILAAAITLVPLGRLADIYGRKRIFLYGAIIFTLASSFCIWSPTQFFLIVARAIQGIGGAMIFSTGTAMLISAYPSRRKRQNIRNQSNRSLYRSNHWPFYRRICLLQHLGWRYIFLFTVFLGIIIIYILIGYD